MVNTETKCDDLVVIIDDDAEILSAFSSLLNMEGYSCETYLSATDYLQALAVNEDFFTGSSCVLCDVRMPDLDGLELQKHLSEHWHIPLVLMSGDSGAQEVAQGFRAGAIDFLIKPIDINTLLNVVEKSLKLSSERREKSNRVTDLTECVAGLTPRELEVARCVIQGKTNQTIADELNIALRTVKLHRQRVMEKLGVQSVADLVRIFIELGL